MLKKLLLASAAASLTLAMPTLAATITGTFSFAGSDTGTVNFTAVPAIGPVPATYQITSVTGTTDGSAIAGIIQPQIYPPAVNGIGDASDNFFFDPTLDGGYLDFYGLSYSLQNGSDVNIFYVAPPNFDPGYFTDIDNNPSFTPLTLTLNSISGLPSTAVTPEPESLALVGTGILGLVGILRRRFAQ